MSETRPNIIFIMSDDHAAHAMSCYGSRINKTPNLDRLADGGMRFDSCFCTNSICTPSRAGKPNYIACRPRCVTLDITLTPIDIKGVMSIFMISHFHNQTRDSGSNAPPRFPS